MVPDPLRVGVGATDPDRLHQLLQALDTDGAMAPVRARSADALLDLARRGAVDVLVLDGALHGLTEAMRIALATSGVPLVVTAPDGDEDRWSGVRVAPDAPSRELCAAVRTAWARRASQRRGSDRPRPDAPTAIAPAATAAGEDREDASAMVIAVAGGHGAPGRTTVALNLATALGAVAPTCLWEADVTAPALALLLESNPTHHTAVLRHRDPRTDADWRRALDEELQPLDARSPHGRVLLGLPKPALRASITPDWSRRLLVELRRDVRYVVLDHGPELVSPDQALHRSLLADSDLVLVVAHADALGVRRAQAVVACCRDELALSGERLAVVVNAYEKSRDDPPASVSAVLGLPLAAVIPRDSTHARRALDAGRPLVALGRGPGSRALLGLADRLHGGRVTLPVERADRGRRLVLVPAWLRRGGTWTLRSEGGSHVAREPEPTGSRTLVAAERPRAGTEDRPTDGVAAPDRPDALDRDGPPRAAAAAAGDPG